MYSALLVLSRALARRGGLVVSAMMQPVIEQMRSPFDRSSVLTLACGHLWSWLTADPPPAEINCIHCDAPPPEALLTPSLTPVMRELDLAVRNLRRRRHGLPPLDAQ